jgi:hypothetical protein
MAPRMMLLVCGWHWLPALVLGAEPAATVKLTVNPSNVTHQLRKLDMGCHSDSESRCHTAAPCRTRPPHAHTHARPHARMHARTHARTLLRCC